MTNFFTIDNGIPWLAFPSGVLQLQGSCEFATRECLQYCYAMSDFNPKQVANRKFFTDQLREAVSRVPL